MSRTVHLILIFTMLSWSGPLQAKDSWQKLTPEGGDFSIMMPAEPKRTDTITRTPVGKIREEMYTAETKSLSVLAEFSKLPGIAVFFASRKTILRKSADGLIKSEKGKVISSKDLEIGGKPGKVIQYNAPGPKGKPNLCTAHLVLNKKLLYVLIARSPEAKPDKAGMKKFLDSFQLEHSKK